VNIACSTGTWLDIPRTFLTTGPERVARLFVREIEQGIEGTGIKPAVIKASTDSDGLTPGSELSLRSAAMASVATGTPISTHTWAPGETGAMQADIFEREGVDMSRVCIGHSDDTDDVPFLISLLDRGVWLGLDHMSAYGHREGTPNTQTRIETAWKLIEAGYESRIMLSHDFWISVGVFDEAQMADKQAGNPDGYSFIPLGVLPKLRELGATDEQIRKITVDNPRRFLTGASA
jgi:phosphotriesterase-related protein